MFELNLLPKQADNRYQGNRYALWFFVAFLLLMTWRSIIHMLFEETGYFDIANFVLLVGEPDPMPVVFRFFSLWGFAQLIFCMVCWLVVFRYRSLIPLMYLFWLFEWTGRLRPMSMRANLYRPGHFYLGCSQSPANVLVMRC